MGIGAKDHDSVKTYSGVVGGTAVEVTDEPDSLIYGIYIYNGTAAVAFLQIFDADSANVIVGTTAPTRVLEVGIGVGLSIMFPKPIRHTVGFTIASTTTRTGLTAASQDVNILYMD